MFGSTSFKRDKILEFWCKIPFSQGILWGLNSGSDQSFTARDLLKWVSAFYTFMYLINFKYVVHGNALVLNLALWCYQKLIQFRFPKSLVYYIQIISDLQYWWEDSRMKISFQQWFEYPSLHHNIIFFSWYWRFNFDIKLSIGCDYLRVPPLSPLLNVYIWLSEFQNLFWIWKFRNKLVIL